MSLRKWPLFISFIVLPALILSGCNNDDDNPVDPSPSPSKGLLINEVLSSNDAILADEMGEYDDWIELFNDSDEDIDIGGYFITDDMSDPTQFRFTTDNPLITTIPAKGYLILWADNDADQGPLHLNFKLGGLGETVALFDANGQLVNQVVFGPQNTDISFGRLPNGSNTWAFLIPTPTAANGELAMNQPPVFETVDRSPITPAEDETVLISATVYDENGLSNVKLMYRVDSSEFTALPMTFIEDHRYSSVIPGHVEGSVVSYYVIATDTDDRTAQMPMFAPSSTYTYTVMEQTTPTGIQINEFMADNETTIADNFAEFDDWIELHNTTDEPINIAGMYLSDDPSIPLLHQIPATAPDQTTIPAHGYIVLWADNDTEQGVLHLGFKLSADEGTISLYDTNLNNNYLIDSITYPQQNADISYGRFPENSDSWTYISNPTPGTSN